MAHNGHLYEMEILLKWTPRVGPRPAPAFLYSLNLFDIFIRMTLGARRKGIHLRERGLHVSFPVNPLTGK